MSLIRKKVPIDKARLNYDGTLKFRDTDVLETFNTLYIRTPYYNIKGLKLEESEQDFIQISFNCGAIPLKWENSNIGDQIIIPRHMEVRTLDLIGDSNFKLESGKYKLAILSPTINEYSETIGELFDYLDSHAEDCINASELFDYRVSPKHVYGRQIYGLADTDGILLLGKEDNTIVDQIVRTYMDCNLGIQSANIDNQGVYMYSYLVNMRPFFKDEYQGT